MLKALIFLAAAAAISAQELGYRYVPPTAYRRPAYYNRPIRYTTNVDDPDVRPRAPVVNYIEDESPKPYSFSYNAPLDDGVGSSSRTETADGTGRVEGSYTLTNDEGHTRVVEYVADEGGFRANVRTNEPGTSNQSPASVNFESSATLYDYRPEVRGPAIRRRPVSYRAPAVAVEEPVVVEQPVEQPVVQPVLEPLPRPAVYSRPYYRGQLYRRT